MLRRVEEKAERVQREAEIKAAAQRCDTERQAYPLVIEASMQEQHQVLEQHKTSSCEQNEEVLEIHGDSALHVSHFNAARLLLADELRIMDEESKEQRKQDEDAVNRRREEVEEEAARMQREAEERAAELLHSAHEAAEQLRREAEAEAALLRAEAVAASGKAESWAQPQPRDGMKIDHGAGSPAAQDAQRIKGPTHQIKKAPEMEAELAVGHFNAMKQLLEAELRIIDTESEAHRKQLEQEASARIQQQLKLAEAEAARMRQEAEVEVAMLRQRAEESEAHRHRLEQEASARIQQQLELAQVDMRQEDEGEAAMLWQRAQDTALQLGPGAVTDSIPLGDLVLRLGPSGITLAVSS